MNIKSIKDKIRKVSLAVLLALAVVVNEGNLQAAPIWDNVAHDQTSGQLNYPHITNDFASSIASTNAGSEGIRKVGALGGYTLEEFIEDNMTRGPARDLPQFVYNTNNLVVIYSGGDVYDPVNGYFHLDSGTKTLTDNAVNFAYWSTNDVRIVQWQTGERPDPITSIYLGAFITSRSKIILAAPTIAVGDELLYEDSAFANIFPSLVIEGLSVRATGTALTNIIIDAGVEYHNMADRIEHHQYNFGGATNRLVMYGHTASNWTDTVTNLFPIGKWDDGTNIIACDASKWYRGVFVSLDGDLNQLTWVAPDYQYTTDVDAIAGNDPDLPDGFVPYIPKCTAYIFKGDDAVLRVSSTYWVDRRNADNLLKSAVTGGGSGGANTPTLGQVMQAGSSLGGILPHDAGLPVDPDQLSSKEYVDSTRNKASTGMAYVDPVNGDDLTGRPQKASLPFKTIKAARDACIAVATDTNRFLIAVSLGTYDEGVLTWPNFISLRGQDIEATIINGQIVFSPTYTDVTGTEIQVLTIKNTNGPAVIVNAGDNGAYMGFRSCGIYSSYTNGTHIKPVIQASRGDLEVYATTWLQHNNNPTVETGSVDQVCFYYGTTDPANIGTYKIFESGGSHIMSNSDTNDIVSLAYSDATSDSIMVIKDAFTTIDMNDSVDHKNIMKLVYNKNSSARTLINGATTLIDLNISNQCDLILACASNSIYSQNSVAHYNNGRVIAPNVAVNKSWIGSAATTNDVVEIFNSQVGVYSTAYPQKYTNEGALGEIAYVMQHDGGDIILGGGIDLSASYTTGITPKSGHIKMYTYTYAGLESPYFIDSSSNKVRLARDHFFNGYNSETTTLQVGEAVYVTAGISPANTPIVKRANASDASKMPCAGIVSQVGGIGTNRIGRVMRGGRLEEYFDTSKFTSGDKLFVSVVDGKLTNNPPTGNNIEQQVGWAHIASTNGLMNVYLWTPNTLGGLTPNKYVTYANPVFASSLFKLTNGGTARFNTADIPTGQTNDYILPSEGGQLATYTDIQLVPVSVVVGESGGIAKGRVVYQSGVSSGKPVVKYADRRYSETFPVVGVTMASGNLGDIINVANFGPLDGVDTSAFNPNDLLYLGTNGFLSSPSAVASDAIIMLGTCMSNAVSGSILVNIRAYFMDGSFSGSMRYTVKNDSSSTNATANFFAINEADESIRIGIRSTNHFQGTGAYLTAGAGQLIFGNIKKSRMIWDIDMTDSGTDFGHLAWPVMALVPQANSNAFLGIGTTNPLAKLHVAGSINSSNSFRLATGAYGNTEHITYADTTNLINILNTNLQSQVDSATNALTNEVNARVVGDTNLQSQVDSATNRVKILENGSNLWNQASIDGINATNRVKVMESRTSVWEKASVDGISATSRIFVVEGRTSTWNQAVSDVSVIQGRTSVWEKASTDGINATGRVSILEGRSNLWNQASVDGINATNRVKVMESRTSIWEKASADGIDATNRVKILEGRTNLWNQASVDGISATNSLTNEVSSRISEDTNLQAQIVAATNLIASSIPAAKRFKANIGNTNITYAGSLALVPFTNVVLAASGGSIYSNGNTVAQWRPKATNGIVKFYVSWQAASANGATYVISIYKNGSRLTDVYNWNIVINIGNNSLGSTWTFVDTATPTLNDYYQVYTTFNSTRLSVNTGTNNWWFGEVEY